MSKTIEIEKRKYKKIDELTYSMQIKYINAWKDRELRSIFREVVSNALDEHKSCEILLNEEKLTCEIRDKGSGFEPSCLLMGHSEKKEEGSIGQFGEGMKLSAFLCLSSARKFAVMTRNYLFVPFFYTQFEEKCVGFSIYRCKEKIAGTRVVFSLLNRKEIEEIELLKQMFLCFKPRTVIYERKSVGQIFEESGHFYINGVEVQKDNFMFSYNIYSDKINRDRNALSNQWIRNKVTFLIKHCDDERVFRRILETRVSNNQYFEENFTMYFNQAAKEKLSSMFYKIYGSSAVLSTDPELWEKCIYHHKKPVKLAFSSSFQGCDILTDIKFLREIDAELRRKSFLKYSTRKLTKNQRYNIGTAVKLLRAVHNTIIEKNLIEFYYLSRTLELHEIKERILFFKKEDCNEPRGFCDGGKIFVSFEALDEMHACINVLMHEWVHLVKDEGDGSSFAVSLGEFLSILVCILREKTNRRLLKKYTKEEK